MRRSAHRLSQAVLNRESFHRAISDALESRLLLANIVWTNRNLASNNFAATFGANSAAAINVVDVVIQHWERVIDNFNWASATQYNLSISMRNQAAPDFGGQTNPGNMTIDANGVPTSAQIVLGRGNDTNGDTLGDGGGWYLDPTPEDFAEFTTIVNNFAGTATGGAAAAGNDFYSVIAHEMGHAMGMTSNNGSDWRTFLPTFASNTGINDTGGAGVLWAYSSATVGRAVLTDSDLAGSGVTAVHVARAGQSFNFNGQSYVTQQNLMNNTIPPTGQRRLINNLVVGMFADTYGYATTWPEQFGSMYTSLNADTGLLTLRGGATGSNDTFTVLYSGSNYTITVNIGNDVPGTGPTDAYVATFTDAQVSGIVINAGDGNDSITIRTLSAGEPVTVNAGDGDDTITLSNGDFDTDLDSDVTINGDAGTDSLRVLDVADGAGSDIYTLSTNTFSKPARTATHTGINIFDIDGSDQDDVYNLESASSGMVLSVDGSDGNDTFNIAQSSGDLDSLPTEMTLFGSLGNDTLNLFDENDSGADSYLFDSAAGPDFLNFTKVGNAAGFIGLNHSSFSTLNFNANGGSNLVTIEQLTPASVTFALNGGNDTVALGDGNIDLNIGSSTLALDGGLGNDSLRLLDASDTGADTYVFDRNGTTGLFGKENDPFFISYTGNEFVSLAAANTSNIIRVDGLPSATNLTVSGGLGSDTLLLGDGDVDTNILGSVNFDGFINGHIEINDASDGIGSDTYNLNGATFSKVNGSVHTFSNFVSLDIDGSANNDAYNISNTFGYTLNLTAGDGDDTITLGNGDVAFMGAVTLFGSIGTDRLIVNDSTASAGHSVLVAQAGGFPFVDFFNGNLRFYYDSIFDIFVNAGPLNDTLRSENIPSGTRLQFSGGGGSDSFDIEGHNTLNNAALPRVTVISGTGDDTLQINNDGGGSAYVDLPQSESFATLGLTSGADLRLGTGNLLLEVVNSLTMPTTGVEVDLRDGRFVRRNNPSLPFYQTRVISGFGGGTWNGDGFNSSTAAVTPNRALGYARGSDLFATPTGVVSGTSLNAGDVFLAYTIRGDANLDRVVNFDDLLLEAQNYGLAGNWHQGDFDYNLAVNFDDLLVIAQNYNQSILSDLPAYAARSGPTLGRNVNVLY